MFGPSRYPFAGTRTAKTTLWRDFAPTHGGSNGFEVRKRRGQIVERLDERPTFKTFDKAKRWAEANALFATGHEATEIVSVKEEVSDHQGLKSEPRSGDPRLPRRP